MAVLASCGGSSKRVERNANGGTSSGTEGTGGKKPLGNGGTSASGGGGGTANVASGGSTSMGATGGTAPSTMAGSGSDVGGTAGGFPVVAAGEGGEPNGTGATGGRGGATGQGGMPGQAGMPATTITSCTEDFPFLGTWEGSVLDFYFEPMKPLVLELRENDEHEIVGTFVNGEGDPPPPPESGDEPWPPGFFDDGDMKFFEGPQPIPGFEYTVVRGAGCDTTFRFGIATAEPWDEWCALQEPLLGSNGTYGCVKQGGGASSDQTTCTTQDGRGNTLGSYPVWKCDLCGVFDGQGVCACDENHCYARRDPTLTYDFSLSTSGDTAVLSGKDPECGDCTDRLERE